MLHHIQIFILTCGKIPFNLAGTLTVVKEQQQVVSDDRAVESSPDHTTTSSSGTVSVSDAMQKSNTSKSLKDAVKLKKRKKNRASTTTS